MNVRTADVAASSHCQSSTASSTSPGRAASSDRQASATRRGSTGPAASSSSSAAASARRCGVGQRVEPVEHGLRAGRAAPRTSSPPPPPWAARGGQASRRPRRPPPAAPSCRRRRRPRRTRRAGVPGHRGPPAATGAPLPVRRSHARAPSGDARRNAAPSQAGVIPFRPRHRGILRVADEVGVSTSTSGRTMQMRSKWLGALLSAVVVGMVMPAAALAAKPAATTGTPAKLTYQSVRLNGVGRSEQAEHDLLLPVRDDDRARDADRAVPGRQRRQGRARPHRRHGPRAGHEVLLPARRPQQLGHGARQAALVHDQEAAARPLAGRDPEPGARQEHGDAGQGHPVRHGQRRPQGRPAVQRVAVHAPVPERVQRAGHRRERQLRVPAAERAR